MSTNKASQALTYQPSKVSWATAEFVREPPAVLALVAAYLIAACIVMGIAYSYFAKTPITVSATGELITDRESLPVISSATGKVTRLAVAPNQEVKKDSVILVTENQVAGPTLAAIKGDIAKLDKFVKKDAAKGCGRECARDVMRFSASAFSYTDSRELVTLLQPMQELTREYANSLTRLADQSLLQAETRRQIATATGKLKTIQDEGATKMLASDVESLKSQIGTLRQRLMTDEVQTRSQHTSIRDRLQVRLRGFPTTLGDYTRRQTITAPIDGIVSDLRVSGVGQDIGNGAPILSLIPADATLIANLQVQNQDIAKVRKGHIAYVELQAFDVSKFGRISGVIDEIAAKPTHSEQGGAATYAVRLKLDRQSLSLGGNTFQMKLGMLLSAKIETDRERLLTLAYRKILNIREDLVGR